MSAMSAKLLQNPDGANFQARAVLEMVRHHLGSGIEDSWDDDQKRYLAEPMFCRLDNCREQGYVVFLRSPDLAKQINISFYEHRNTDRIYVQVNDVRTFNAPSQQEAMGHMGDKYASAFTAPCGEIDKVADFIADALRQFWILAVAAK